MARMPDVKAGQEKEAKLLGEQFEVIAVARPWIRELGWPDTYESLVRVAATGDPDVTRLATTRGALIRESYQAQTGPGTDRAYFRKGERGQALLYVQAWTGPA